MKKWCILFLLYFNFLCPRTAIIFINSQNVYEKIIETRKVFCKSIKKQINKKDYIVLDFYISANTCSKLLDVDIETLFGRFTRTKEVVNEIYVICFGLAENILNFVTKKFDQQNLINKIYLFDRCDEIIFQPNFDVIGKIYNFYSEKHKIQDLTGSKIYKFVSGIDKTKIINVNVDTNDDKCKDSKYYYKYFGKKLLSLSDSLDEVQNGEFKDKHLILPSNNNGELIVSSCDFS